MDNVNFSFPRSWYEIINNYIDAETITVEEGNRIIYLLLSEGLDISPLKEEEFTGLEYLLACLLIKEYKRRN